MRILVVVPFSVVGLMKREVGALATKLTPDSARPDWSGMVMGCDR